MDFLLLQRRSFSSVAFIIPQAPETVSSARTLNGELAAIFSPSSRVICKYNPGGVTRLGIAASASAALNYRPVHNQQMQAIGECFPKEFVQRRSYATAYMDSQTQTNWNSSIVDSEIPNVTIAWSSRVSTQTEIVC